MPRERKVHRPRIDKSNKSKIDVANLIEKVGDERKVPIGKVRPNEYNPNHMDDFVFEQLKSWISSQGFLVPIVVRSGDENGPFKKGILEIIDGEHRWKAAKDLGLEEVSVKDCGNVPLSVAKLMTVTLNAGGKEQEDSLAKLVSEINETAPDLMSLLPFDSSEQQAMLATVDEDLKKLQELSTNPGEDGAPDLETGEDAEDPVKEEDDVADFLGLYELTPEEHKAMRKRARKLAKRLHWKDKTPGSLLDRMISICLEANPKPGKESDGD